MKKSFTMIALFFTMMSSFAPEVRAQANRLAFFPGQAWQAGSILQCTVRNVNAVKAQVRRIDYRYTCDQGPNQPIYLGSHISSCFGGMCDLAPGMSYTDVFGPYLWNCRWLLSAFCDGDGITLE